MAAVHELVSPAFYEALGDGRYRATERTEGPWNPQLQHGGPPAALLARALEQCEPRADAFISRLTFELLGAVPLGENTVTAVVERPGRNVELLRAELSAGGRVAMRATAWRLTGATTEAGPAEDPTPPLPATESPAAPAIAHSGYLRSVEWRNAHGTWSDAGPAAVWARPRVPLIEGERMTGLQRVASVADSMSGISSVLEWDQWVFINTDLTIHLTREPRGEWVLLDGVTRIARGGAGLASGAIGDHDGFHARSAQTLLVREAPGQG